MLRFHASINPKPPNYQVKIYITILDNRQHDDLKELRTKLEQMIPGNLKVRYNLSADQLVIVSKTKDGPESQRASVKLMEFVRSAATALKLNF
jgi:hypothetical protein